MEHVLVVATHAEKYLGIIKEIVMSINPAEYKSCESNIELLKTTAEELPKMISSTDRPLDTMLNVYNKFIDVDNAIATLIKLFENTTYSKLALYNMSATYVMNVHQEKNLALNAHDKYLDMSVDDDEIIFDSVFKHINLHTKPDPLISFIIDHEEIINKFTIKLIGAVIKVVTGDKRRRLELIIETQKDKVLEASRVDITKWSGVQGTIVRYGLKPLTLSYAQDKLFEKLNLKYNPKLSVLENFTAIATNSGVILINKSTPSPIEFDLRGIMDINYVMENDLKTTPQSGLTKKIVERFNTARQLPRGTKSEPIVKIHASEKSSATASTWYVFETINGELWRLIGRDGSNTTKSDSIRGLIDGLSTRASQYNNILAEDIIAKCFDPKAKMILDSYEDVKRVLPSSETIKSTIIDGLVEWLGPQLKKNMPKDIADFKYISVDRRVVADTILSALTHTTGIHGKGSSEYMLTYICKLDFIIGKFVKELERQWSLETISDRVFKERSGDDLYKYLMDVFRGIAKSTADQLDKLRLWTEYDISIKEYFLEQKQAVV
jgi:hypothetical protein